MMEHGTKDEVDIAVIGDPLQEVYFRSMRTVTSRKYRLPEKRKRADRPMSPIPTNQFNVCRAEEPKGTADGDAQWAQCEKWNGWAHFQCAALAQEEHYECTRCLRQ